MITSQMRRLRWSVPTLSISRRTAGISPPKESPLTAEVPGLAAGMCDACAWDGQYADPDAIHATVDVVIAARLGAGRLFTQALGVAYGARMTRVFAGAWLPHLPLFAIDDSQVPDPQAPGDGRHPRAPHLRHPRTGASAGPRTLDRRRHRTRRSGST